MYLLDDPLSSVDAHVGRYLFDCAICGYLSAATRILVTHQMQYVEQADYIVIIEDGRITRQGTYAELADAGVDWDVYQY